MCVKAALGLRVGGVEGGGVMNFIVTYLGGGVGKIWPYSVGGRGNFVQRKMMTKN